MSRQNYHTFSFKKTSIIRTSSNKDNGHEISAPESKIRINLTSLLRTLRWSGDDSLCMQGAWFQKPNRCNCALGFNTFYMQHGAVARFFVKQLFVYDCTDLLCSWDVQWWMLLKDSVFCQLWINKSKCSLKTRVSLILAYWILNT